MRTGVHVKLMVICTLLLSAVCVINAQNISGSITGTVRDAGGAVIPNVVVKLEQPATGLTREAVTTDKGDFVFTALYAGEYKLSAHANGFKRLERGNIKLTTAEYLSVGDLTLEIGNVGETVTITAQNDTVQTASAERAGVITSQQVENLLIRGRNVMSLLQLLPGVVDLGDQESISRDWNLNVNGGRRANNGVSLDGVALNAIGNNYNMVVGISQDAVAEVKVLLSNYQAEYGRMSGANIQLVTKSGTKQFHGLGSYFKRHEQFNANNFFNNQLNQPKPRYRFNTWNYNIGGPVYLPKLFNRNKDKLFFFWSQEYWPQRVSRPLSQLTVPTDLERQGDFSQSLDLNGRPRVIRDPTTGQAFPGNRIPANRINPNGQALLKFFPAANFPDRAVSAGRYNYVFQTENTTPQRTETLKLDYHLNP
ncbi:MAG: carboxypeptidase regulatory-like domain-containing protein, partial [Blastocatellia bacterium]